MAYNKVQFIAHCIYTAPLDIKEGKQKYLGLRNTSDDIKERVKLVGKVIDSARTNIPTKKDDSNVLKIFMIPEFFFRGETGAYNMDELQTVVSSLQELVKDKSKWEHWLFVFGSILGNSSIPQSAGLIAKFFKFLSFEAPIDIEAYNFVLVQKGGFGDAKDAGPAAAKAILKEHLSKIDFIKEKNSVGDIVLKRVKHLERLREYGTASEVQIKSYDGSSIFEIDGITFGLEVCLDHSQKRLKGSKNLPTIDIQLVPSCGMSIQDDAIVAKKGGYIFNCDGLYNHDSNDRKVPDDASKVKKIGTPDPLTPDVRTPVEVGDVRIEEIYARGGGELRIYPEQNLS